MSDPWTGLGLKPQYEAGELIVLTEEAPRLLVAGAKVSLTQAGSPQAMPIEVKSSPGNKTYAEFYVVESGTYQLRAPWGLASFLVVPRQSLGFQSEFGIFSSVVVVLVVAMAWRYLRVRPLKKGKKL